MSMVLSVNQDELERILDPFVHSQALQGQTQVTPSFYDTCSRIERR